MDRNLNRFSILTFLPIVTFLALVVRTPVALGASLEQTIRWEAPAKDFIPLNEPTPLLASSSSGLPVTFHVEHGPGVIVDGRLVASGPGAVWVKAEQAGNETYTPASISPAFNLRQAAVSLVGEYSDSAPVRDVAVRGNFLFAACGEQGLHVFDVSDPTVPTLVGQFPDPTDSVITHTTKVRVAGNMAIVANNEEFIAPLSLDVLDVTEPTKPVLRGSVAWRWDAALSMQVAGQFVYVLLPKGLLLIVDVSDPAAPRVFSESHLDDESSGVFQVVGSSLYLGTSTGMSVWDISASTSPVRIAQHLDPIDRGRVRALKVAGGAVYVLMGYVRSMFVFDASDLKLLQEIVFPPDGTISGLETQGDYVFVTRYSLTGCNDCDLRPGGIEVFDVSNPAKPIRVGGFTGYSDENPRVAGDMIYFGGTKIAALKVTLEEPSEPRLEISAPIMGESVLSAPAIPGWQVEYAASPAPETQWSAYLPWYPLESNGIKRMIVNRRLGNEFYRMRKVGF
jgi:hypothetical protein